jgi:hypothetical protein
LSASLKISRDSEDVNAMPPPAVAASRPTSI